MLLVRESNSPSLILVSVIDLLKVPPSWAFALAGRVHYPTLLPNGPDPRVTFVGYISCDGNGNITAAAPHVPLPSDAGLLQTSPVVVVAV